MSLDFTTVFRLDGAAGGDTLSDDRYIGHLDHDRITRTIFDEVEDFELKIRRPSAP